MARTSKASKASTSSTTLSDSTHPVVEPDAACAGAVDLARSAITASLDDIAVDPGVPQAHVGPHLGVTAEIEASATHRFTCLAPGYQGWNWVVLLVRGDGEPSVADVVLLPGDGALQAPAWKPWNERIQPGDLGPGDVLPTSPDDLRLTPGYTGEGDLESVSDPQAVLEVAWELGMGRPRVLSPWGRDDAMSRWFDGETGPESAMARQAPATCVSCGFLMPIRGVAGQAFGACANEMSPADGRIVALEFGCGAHSEVVAPDNVPVDVIGMVIDEIAFDDLAIDRAATAQDVEESQEAEADSGSADLGKTSESLIGEPVSRDEADEEDHQP
jgi:hypothetical protein